MASAMAAVGQAEPPGANAHLPPLLAPGMCMGLEQTWPREGWRREDVA